MDFSICRTLKNPRQLCKNRNCDHKIITIRFNPVNMHRMYVTTSKIINLNNHSPIVSCNGRGINMMFSKWTDKVFTKQRQFDATPCVSSPVHQTTSKVSCDNSTKCRKEHMTQSIKTKVNKYEEKVDKHKSKAGVDTNYFLNSLPYIFV